MSFLYLDAFVDRMYGIERISLFFCIYYRIHFYYFFFPENLGSRLKASPGNIIYINIDSKNSKENYSF